MPLYHQVTILSPEPGSDERLDVRLNLDAIIYVAGPDAHHKEFVRVRLLNKETLYVLGTLDEVNSWLL